MEHQDDIIQDDIPMVDDGPDDPIPPNPTTSTIQRFSIVDVLGGGDAAIDLKEVIGLAPDPMNSSLYEFDEGKVLQRLQELYPHTDIQKLPRHWNKNDRWIPSAGQNGGISQSQILELSSDFLRVTKRKGGTHNSKDAAAVRANRPIPRSCIVYYFEIAVVNKGTGGYMGIGLSEKSVSLNRLPGWDQTSYGYHGDDGNFFASSGKGVEYGPTFTTGDVVGCGLNFVTRQIFFTKNGKHLGVANTLPIPLANDLYPTVGMQTADEMMDANFGQLPFEFDIQTELRAAETATHNAISTIELPPEKVLWMNSLIVNWMAHEGYSRALDALNRSIGDAKAESSASVIKSDSKGSTMSSSSKDSQSPTAVAETVANSVMRSMIGLFGSEAATGASARRSVVRSVQEALHEEMEQRRAVIRLVKRGHLDEAIERIEQLYPTLMNSNKQLALLLKIQQFVEMIQETAKNLPPLQSQQERDLLASSHSPNSNRTGPLAHSPPPRLSSSRGGKRSASSVVEDEHLVPGTSSQDGMAHQHNPIKRRSSKEECPDSSSMGAHHSPHLYHTNGNSAVAPQQQSADEFMEVGEDSQDGEMAAVANGKSNGCPNVLVGTPPTSTTIIDEPVGELLEDLETDGIAMEMCEERDESRYGGFASAEEQNQFSRYAETLEFGHHVSQFALKIEQSGEDHNQGCAALRQRMNEAFSLLCYRDPTQSDHAYLLDQSQRDLVAKALNAAILELHGRDGISPLDKCLSRARFIRDQALAYSASSIFADTNRLLFGKNPAMSPG